MPSSSVLLSFKLPQAYNSESCSSRLTPTPLLNIFTVSLTNLCCLMRPQLNYICRISFFDFPQHPHAVLQREDLIRCEFEASNWSAVLEELPDNSKAHIPALQPPSSSEARRSRARSYCLQFSGTRINNCIISRPPLRTTGENADDRCLPFDLFSSQISKREATGMIHRRVQ